ncbi:putative receptor protein kinase [Planoprotostelium fungivorum]|uniref:Putative receptor protein kinase n=1 Tax=Planoprotostelium fungivorum TaxID=1890364 RepID=A0A2P6N3S8_9EUKA|nr:putative receptor protein kinase [Planoprotostelium fungivorum]
MESDTSGDENYSSPLRRKRAAKFESFTPSPKKSKTSTPTRKRLRTSVLLSQSVAVNLFPSNAEEESDHDLLEGEEIVTPIIPQDERVATYPEDMSVKSRVKIFSSKPIKWIPDDPEVTNDIYEEFLHCTSVHSHPSFPQIPNHFIETCHLHASVLESSQSQEQAANSKFYEHRNRSWTEAFRSVFRNWMTGKMTSFYFSHSTWSAIFRGSVQENTITVVLSRSTWSVRNHFRRAGISFTTPLNPSLVNERDISDAPSNSNTPIRRHATSTGQIGRDANTLLLFCGTEAAEGVFQYINEGKDFGRELPFIHSSFPFINSTNHQITVVDYSKRVRKVKGETFNWMILNAPDGSTKMEDTYCLELEGPILPYHVNAIVDLFVRHQEEMYMSFSTSKDSAGFNISLKDQTDKREFWVFRVEYGPTRTSWDLNPKADSEADREDKKKTIHHLSAVKNNLASIPIYQLEVFGHKAVTALCATTRADTFVPRLWAVLPAHLLSSGTQITDGRANKKHYETLFQAEADILRTLYDELGGEHWINNTHWENTTASYCSYYGITCDEEEHVTAIRLYNNLTGQLPDLSGLSHLTVLDLGGNGGIELTAPVAISNHLTGPFPAWITKTRLEYVDFFGHSFLGVLPDDLGNLVNLTCLSMGVPTYDGRLYGPVPESWMKLTKLKALGLFGNSFTHINLTRLNDLVDLEYLELGSNNFDGSFIEMGLSVITLPKLIHFDIYSNSFYGPIPDLRNCIALQFFYIDYNAFEGGFPEWVNLLPQLIFISMGDNQLSGPIPASLGQLKSLLYLVISGNSFNGTLPDIWDQFPNLDQITAYANKSSKLTTLLLNNNKLTGSISPDYFIVGYNQLNGTIPDELYECTEMYQLNLVSNQFTGTISPKISQLTNVVYLQFGQNRFEGDIPDAFGLMSKLWVLDFSYNQFTGGFPQSITNLTQILQIRANDNQLSGPMPSLSSSLLKLQIQRNNLNGTVFWMSSMPQIQLLDISYNQFSGPCSSINRLNYMTYCDWSNNQLTGRMPPGYTLTMPLYHLDLSSNQLTGNIEYSIGSLSSLAYLNVSRNLLTGSLESRLAQLSQLQYMGAMGLPQMIQLNFDNNNFIGDIPNSVAKSSSMTTLSLGNNQLTGGLQDVFSLPNLMSLNVSGNNLNGNIPDISGSTGLQVIDLSYNRLVGSIPTGLAKQNNLRVLSLSHNQLTGEVPHPLKSDPQIIDLSSNSLSGALSFLDTLSSLTRLNLSGNAFNGQIKTLNGMRGLSSVDVSHNLITTLPSLSGLFNLQYFDASHNTINGSVPDLTGCTSLSTLDLSYNNLTDAMLMTNVPSLSYCSFTHQTFLCPLPAQASHLCQAKCRVDNYQSAEMSIRIAGNVSTFDSASFIRSISKIADISMDRIQIPRTRSGSVIVDLSFSPPSEESSEGSSSRVVSYLNQVGSSAYSSMNITLLSVSDSIMPDATSTSTGLSAGAIAGIVIAVVVFIVFILVIVLLLTRKRRVYKTSFELVDFTQINNNATLKSVIPFSELEGQVMIGSGAYGVVYRASWRSNTVAVKQVRSEHINTDQMQSFLDEATLVQSMRPHPNVVLFMGYTFPPDPLSIVTEFCEGGCLLDYLGTHKNDVTQEKKDSIILGIAKGVLHLHQEKIIHRDLAARNILLSKHLEAKVSDFGMSRQVQTKDTASTTASTIGPVKWMAPEAISKREYTFSFGVVVWEILTCEEPWGDRAMVEVAIDVLNDKRLTIPNNTAPILQAVMKEERPDFVQICSWLSDGAATQMYEKEGWTRDDGIRYDAVDATHMVDRYASTDHFLNVSNVEEEDNFQISIFTHHIGRLSLSIYGLFRTGVDDGTGTLWITDCFKPGA